MRNGIVATVLAGALVIGASAVMAQPPVSGTYKSTNLDFSNGRESVCWVSPTGSLLPGSVNNTESWNGSALGTEWRLYCGQALTVNLIYDGPLYGGGSGARIYLITYVGGYVELDGAGPWGGGDPVYNAVIDSYTETRTLNFVNYLLTGGNSNHSIQASLDGDGEGCLQLIYNSVLIGDTDPYLIPITDTNVKPANYPAFVNGSCVPTAAPGHWGDTVDFTLSVLGCAVPVREKTWGAVKQLYKN